MTAVLWRIGTDAATYEADDLSGTGAKLSGGRWNTAGKAVVYTASTASLACLETVVHLGAGTLPLNRFLVEISVPDDVWKARQTQSPASLPIGWSAIPAGKVSLTVGDTWIDACTSALLVVPSVVVPEEINVLINPLHADAAKIKAKKVRQWFYDNRLHSEAVAIK